MITSIVSALTGIAVRKEVAMTGEISLRGRVMPIGGLKEKLLAALRGGLKTVLIPKENERDLPEIPDNVKKGLEIIPVSTVDEVLARALVKPLTAIEWPNDLDGAAPSRPRSRPRSAPTKGRPISNQRSPGAIRGFVAFWAPFVRSCGARTRKIWYSALTPFCAPPLHSRLPDFQGIAGEQARFGCRRRRLDQPLQDRRANAVDSILTVITKSLKKKEKVLLVGFGTFQVSKRKAGEGRNPQTGEKIKIPAVDRAALQGEQGLEGRDQLSDSGVFVLGNAPGD